MISKRIFQTVVLLLCTGFLLGANQCQKQTDQTDGSPQFVTTLTLEDTSDNPLDTFTSGQTIRLKVSIYNRSDTTQTVWFNSGQEINFAVVDAGTATVVWNSSIGKDFTTGFTSLTFTPNQTQEFTVDWPQTDSTGIQLPTGQYEVIGGLTMYNLGGQSYVEDDADAMAKGNPDPSQLTPTQYRSVLNLFTID